MTWGDASSCGMSSACARSNRGRAAACRNAGARGSRKQIKLAEGKEGRRDAGARGSRSSKQMLLGLRLFIQ